MHLLGVEQKSSHARLTMYAEPNIVPSFFLESEGLLDREPALFSLHDAYLCQLWFQ